MKQDKLILACIKGDCDALQVLITHGIDLNLATEEGFTPLLLAAYNGHVKILNLLINKVQLDKRDTTGKNALMLASYAGHLEVVKFLVDKIDIDLTDEVRVYFNLVWLERLGFSFI